MRWEKKATTLQCITLSCHTSDCQAFREMNECAWCGFRSWLHSGHRSTDLSTSGAWQGWKPGLMGSATSSVLSPVQVALQGNLCWGRRGRGRRRRCCCCCCCCTRLIPALRRRMQLDLWVRGQPDYIVSETRSQKPKSTSRLSLTAVHNLITRLFFKNASIE